MPDDVQLAKTMSEAVDHPMSQDHDLENQIDKHTKKGAETQLYRLGKWFSCPSKHDNHNSCA